MRVLTKLLCFTLVCFLAATSVSFAASPAGEGKEDEVVLVGRIAHVEGSLLRYVPDEKDWVATVKDAPFGLDDALYSDAEANAEFTMPNSVWLRIGGSTQIQLIVLKPDYTEIDVASGISRFYNRSSEGVIKATTPFGYVLAPPGTVFDLYVGDESVEVISLKGDVDFVDENEQSKFVVASGETSIVADSRTVVSGEGQVDAQWDDWNSDRDTLWSKRVDVRGESVQYLPEALHDDAYELEEYGRWESVEYEGSSRRLWRPAHVSAGWRPFTAGRWTTYYGDQCWIPAEPFGYVTHHYGSWVYTNNFWYWAPPVATVAVVAPVAPAVNIGFGWYPGRVSWIHSGVSVGWVPLAPAEVYYTHRWWGPRTVVVSNVSSVNINIGRLRWADHAVVVNQSNFYSVNNYSNVRITNINRTVIVNNYRSAPVINQTVITNFGSNRQRYMFNANARLDRIPHQTVVNRIARNRQIAIERRGINAARVQQRMSNLREIRAERMERAAAVRPRITNRLVEERMANRPATQVQFRQTQLKERAKAARESRISRDERLSERLNVVPRREIGERGRRVGPASGEGQPGRRIGPPTAGERRQPGEFSRPEAPGERGRRVGSPTGEQSQPGRRAPRAIGQDDAASDAPTDGRRVRPERPTAPDRFNRPERPGRRTPGEQLEGAESAGRPGRPTPPDRAERLERGRRAPGQQLEGAEPAGRPGRPAPPDRRERPERPGRQQMERTPAEAPQPGEQPAARRMRPQVEPRTPAQSREMRSPADPSERRGIRTPERPARGEQRPDPRRIRRPEQEQQGQAPEPRAFRQENRRVSPARAPAQAEERSFRPQAVRQERAERAQRQVRPQVQEQRQQQMEMRRQAPQVQQQRQQLQQQRQQQLQQRQVQQQQRQQQLQQRQQQRQQQLQEVRGRGRQRAQEE